MIKKSFERKSTPIEDMFPNAIEGRMYRLLFERGEVIARLIKKTMAETCTFQTLATDMPWKGPVFDLNTLSLIKAVEEIQPENLPQYMHLTYIFPAFDLALKGAP